MKFLAVGRVDLSLPENEVQEAFLALADDSGPMYSLSGSGQVHSMYWAVDNSGSVLIFDADSVEAANEMLTTLPSVQRGFTRFDLTEITPVWERSGDS